MTARAAPGAPVSAQRRVHRPPQRLDRLAPDRQPHEALVHRVPPARPALPGRVHAPEARRLGDRAAARQEALGRRRVRERDADEEAEARRLTRRDPVRGILLEPRVAHRAHRRVLAQPPRDRERAPLHALEPELERLEPAQQQPRLERPRDGARQRAPLARRFQRGVVARGEVPHQHVRVPARRLRVGRDDDVGAEIERALQVRRHRRVVDGEPGAGGVRAFGDEGEVARVEPRVRRRLGEHQRCARERRVREVGGRVLAQLDAERGEEAVREGARVVVAVGRQHECVPRAQGRHEQRRDRGHAGREEGAVRALDQPERALGVAPRRVRRPAVVVRPRRLAGLVERGRQHRRPDRRVAALRARARTRTRTRTWAAAVQQPQRELVGVRRVERHAGVRRVRHGTQTPSSGASTIVARAGSNATWPASSAACGNGSS